MSRVAADVNVIEQKPQNNVYTVLVAVAALAQLIAFAAIYVKAGQIFAEGKTLFGG